MGSRPLLYLRRRLHGNSVIPAFPTGLEDLFSRTDTGFLSRVLIPRRLQDWQVFVVWLVMLGIGISWIGLSRSGLKIQSVDVSARFLGLLGQKLVRSINRSWGLSITNTMLLQALILISRSLVSHLAIS